MMTFEHYLFSLSHFASSTPASSSYSVSCITMAELSPAQESAQEEVNEAQFRDHCDQDGDRWLLIEGQMVPPLPAQSTHKDWDYLLVSCFKEKIMEGRVDE